MEIRLIMTVIVWHVCVCPWLRTLNSAVVGRRRRFATGYVACIGVLCNIPTFSLLRRSSTRSHRALLSVMGTS